MWMRPWRNTRSSRLTLSGSPGRFCTSMTRPTPLKAPLATNRVLRTLPAPDAPEVPITPLKGSLPLVRAPADAPDGASITLTAATVPRTTATCRLIWGSLLAQSMTATRAVPHGSVPASNDSAWGSTPPVSLRPPPTAADVEPHRAELLTLMCSRIVGVSIQSRPRPAQSQDRSPGLRSERGVCSREGDAHRDARTPPSPANAASFFGSSTAISPTARRILSAQRGLHPRCHDRSPRRPTDTTDFATHHNASCPPTRQTLSVTALVSAD